MTPRQAFPRSPTYAFSRMRSSRTPLTPLGSLWKSQGVLAAATPICLKNSSAQCSGILPAQPEERRILLGSHRIDQQFERSGQPLHTAITARGTRPCPLPSSVNTRWMPSCQTSRSRVKSEHVADRRLRVARAAAEGRPASRARATHRPGSRGSYSVSRVRMATPSKLMREDLAAAEMAGEPIESRHVGQEQIVLAVEGPQLDAGVEHEGHLPGSPPASGMPASIAVGPRIDGAVVRLLRAPSATCSRAVSLAATHLRNWSKASSGQSTGKPLR